MISALRARQMRNFIATLLLSQGVPMMLARRRARPHAERQQQRLLPGQRDLAGCDWNLDDDARALLDFATRVVATAQAPSAASPAHVLSRARARRRHPDIVWLNPDGREMTDAEWNQPFAHALGAHLPAAGVERDRAGRPVEDDDLLLLLNAHHDGDRRSACRSTAAARNGSRVSTRRVDDGRGARDGLRVRRDRIRCRVARSRCYATAPPHA